MKRIITLMAAFALPVVAPGARAADAAAASSEAPSTGTPAPQTSSAQPPSVQAPTPSSSPLMPDGRLMLRRGERATIGLDRHLRMVVRNVEAVGPDGPLLRKEKPAKGDIVLYLGLDQTTGSFLRVENGAGDALLYKAVIVVPREGDLDYVPTSICPVPAHTSGLEAWPNDVVGMIVGPFTKVDPKTTTCMP